MTLKKFECHSLGEILISSQYGLNIPSSDDGIFPIFKMNNFNQGKMDPSGVDKVKISSAELENYRLEKGDILFNRTNSIALVGKAGIFDLDGIYVFASYLVRLKVNPQLACARYINYFLNADSTKKRLKALATTGVSQANINPTLLKKNLFVFLPPLSEQVKITKILLIWDKGITTTEKLLANSEQQKKALMQQLLTGKKRLPDFSKNWNHGRLGDLCDFKGGSAFKEEQQGKGSGVLPFIKVSDMNLKGNEIFIHNANNWVSFKAANEMKAKPFPKGVIVFAKVGAALLLNRRRILQQDTIIDNNMMAAIPKQSADTTFLYQVFLVIDFARLVQDGAVPSINQSDLSQFKIHYPDIGEQRKIGAMLSIADREIKILQEKLGCIRREKKALMQQLLTGKRRVQI